MGRILLRTHLVDVLAAGDADGHDHVVVPLQVFLRRTRPASSAGAVADAGSPPREAALDLGLEEVLQAGSHVKLGCNDKQCVHCRFLKKVAQAQFSFPFFSQTFSSL